MNIEKKINGEIYKVTFISATKIPKVLKLASNDCCTNIISLYSTLDMSLFFFFFFFFFIIIIIIHSVESGENSENSEK